MQMIGDRCYITRVRPGSDAASQHLAPGEQVLEVVNQVPFRDTFWKLNYVLTALWPQQQVRMKLQELNGDTREVIVKANLRELGPDGREMFSRMREGQDNLRQRLRIRYFERGSQLLIVKLPLFLLSSGELDQMTGRMKKHDSVALDLRGNPGGSIEAVQDVLGAIFDKDVRIGDRVGRNSTKPLEVKSHHNPSRATLAVLVDSESSSGSELLARVIQIEKRGFVLGDHSAGRVMEARHYAYTGGGFGTVAFYGASITEADIKMKDGESVERKGVAPDALIIPTASDLANNRDPALALAAKMLGVEMTAEEAGTLFPYEWSKQ
jgi:C-terminal processing protease CtpA/Prc